MRSDVMSRDFFPLSRDFGPRLGTSSVFQEEIGEPTLTQNSWKSIFSGLTSVI